MKAKMLTWIKSNKWLVMGLVAALMGAFIVFTGIQPNSWYQQRLSRSSRTNAAGTTTIAKTAYTSNEKGVQAYKKVLPSVVTVQNLQKTASLSQGADAVLNQNKQNQNGDSLQTAAEGSGVVYKVQNGYAYIVTNNHVVEGSAAIQLVTYQGKKIQAEVTATDAIHDLAIVKAKTNELKSVASFGSVKNIKSGQKVWALGSPLGSEYASSMSSGIISAPRRELSAEDTGSSALTAIQTDAAINPGNSGGALINSSGDVIGINSSKISAASNGTNIEGIGFAIPIDIVQDFISQNNQ
ncbi:S1C family serine protease [Eupransor demetentiae]|uniref:S1-C subfamily n=1 Tax=Eupransor demetentiae TaxID=3109584 RepID=A0ABP0ETL0_9LACO|nr:Periplasmic serine protease [Lactobacillaceae bacterium LMG 33000]